MSYIGEQPRFSDYPQQVISPNGTDTTFTLSNSVGTPASIIVSISGVKQIANTAYSVTDTTLEGDSSVLKGLPSLSGRKLYAVIA